MTMTRRRFLSLAAVLVAVNTFFWLAQSGFALPTSFICSMNSVPIQSGIV